MIPDRLTCNSTCADRWEKRTEQCKENHYYSKSAKYFYKTIAVEVHGVYDGALYYMCPDCNGTWHRWPETHRLFEAAAPFIHDSQEEQPEIACRNFSG